MHQPATYSTKHYPPSRTVHRSTMGVLQEETTGVSSEPISKETLPRPPTIVESFEVETINNEEYPRGMRLLTVITAVVLAMFLSVLDMTILATAVPRITDAFHSLDDVGWYGSVFFMTVASSQSTWGKAFKYFDLKTVFLTTIAIFEVGSLTCGENAEPVTGIYYADKT